MLKEGFYQQLIYAGLDEEIRNSEDKSIKTASFTSESSSRELARYVAEIVELRLKNIEESEKSDRVLGEQIRYVNELIGSIFSGGSSFVISKPDEPMELLSVLPRKNCSFSEKDVLQRPATPLSQSCLFTANENEPQLFTELIKEIMTADRVDMLVSFVKWSGTRLIIDALRRFTSSGRRLRIITTCYMGATDAKAVSELSRLDNTEIRISYDTKSTRLHAKAYIFYRDTGFTTAYVGSSNLSNAAISSGLEWNLKIARKDLPQTISKITQTFDIYWNSSKFELFVMDDDHIGRLKKALNSERNAGAGISDGAFCFSFDLNPYPYQKRILDQLEAERVVRGKYANLVVTATGTGKTMIAAFDYRRFCQSRTGSRPRLLFVAHRAEILEQSLYSFRAVLRDANFGELLVGSHEPKSFDYLFLSIQSCNSRNFTDHFSPDFYDYIVIDEFHHAAAATYQTVLEYFRPKILLGLTATPERMDGRDILKHFDHRIAAEIRLPEAIEQRLLCPFQYFGVTDVVDLSAVQWSRGGYDAKQLSDIYTINELYAGKRAETVVQKVTEYVADVRRVCGLGFCVSVAHAEFMRDFFNKCGIPSVSLSGGSPEEDRNKARSRLVSGEINFIFVVDLFNEGVDIPEIDTILFLRPTESLTVFLQQLGRGLRLCDTKECLTVLDFIGQANKKYNFEEKFRALLSTGSRHVLDEIRKDFPSVPKGCYIALEKVASEYILSNIRNSYEKVGVARILEMISSFRSDTGKDLSITSFIDYSHLDPKEIYRHKISFSRLMIMAGVMASDVKDVDLFVKDGKEKIWCRLADIDSKDWIDFLMEFLPGVHDYDALTPDRVRMLKMFHITAWDEYRDVSDPVFKDRINRLSKNDVLLNEILELLSYCRDRIGFVDRQITSDIPLFTYCRYTREQLLVAFDETSPQNMREGVKYIPAFNTDLLLVTLNKSEKEYSPTTLYEDYSINEWLFHWQSQSTTSSQSPTGQRYIGVTDFDGKNTILLFVRENKKDPVSGNAEAYTLLGRVRYVSHSGDKPMSITWKLETEILSKFISKTQNIMAG